MKEIFPSLYQFTVTIPGMGFTIHQYLLNGECPILFATGTVSQAKRILPVMKELLGDKSLEYIFISHVESDECGGLFVFQEEYPNVKVLCSELAARELPGYGYDVKIISCSPQTELVEKDLILQFLQYPSEVHMQNGLVVLENNRGILYSSDLFLSFGEAEGMCKDADWNSEVDKIDAMRVPNEVMLTQLKQDLHQITPRFVAVGHGYCMNHR